MATSTSYDCFTFAKHIAVSLTAAVIFLAWGPLTPARGQCTPQELAKLIASDAAGFDRLGVSVAVDGDTAVVGAYTDSHPGASEAGSAYVFVRSGGVWTEQAKLIASDFAVNDQFGISVAVEGDTAVVGAWQDDDVDAGGNSGSAYVFVRSGTVWTQQQKLTATDAAANNRFGTSVAVSGDTAVIGARVSSGIGFAYVFVRSGTVWTQQAKLIDAGEMSTNSFGISVAVSGDTAVIGASDKFHSGGPPGGSLSKGAAFVFVRSGTVWTQQAGLTASDAMQSDRLGVWVSMSGDTVIAGAYQDDHAVGFDHGSAYVFVKPPGGWTSMTETAKLTASDAASSDVFGISVALSGDTALVGALGDDHAGGLEAGSAYVFVKPPGGWSTMTETAKLTASDAAVNDLFGVSVALSGETAVVGAYFDVHAAGPGGPGGQGSAYVFDLTNCDADDTLDVCEIDSDSDGVIDDCDDDIDNDGVPNTSDDCPTTPVCTAADPSGRPRSDLNLDCNVDGLDIQPLVNCILNGGAACVGIDPDGDSQTADLDATDDIAAFVTDVLAPSVAPCL